MNTPEAPVTSPRPASQGATPPVSASGADSGARVGIVIRTKDRPLFVVRALQTVSQQSFKAWQIALVNDGGDPVALDAAITAAGHKALFTSGQALRLDQPVSVGRSEAFNVGARALATEFVCCLDDDDTWEPEFLERLVAFFDHTVALAPDLGGVASLVTAIREDIVVDNGTEMILTLGEDSLPLSFKRTDFFINPIAYATYRHDVYPVQWMLKREAALAIGGFSPDFNVMEDRAFMTLFLQRWQLAVLDKPLAHHHRRVQRTGDKARSIQMNTLDNPSYDWRLFSDLAKIGVHSPAEAETRDPIDVARAGALVRAAAATVVKELNDETSALWHKINGEAQSLRAQIEGLDARIGQVVPPDNLAAEGGHVWSLWDAVGEGDLGYPLGAGIPFLEHFVLSMPAAQSGLLLHAVPAQRRLTIQVPRVAEFAAMEMALSPMIEPKGGLVVDLCLSSAEGYVFETALSVNTRDRLGRTKHAFVETHVHSVPPGGWTRVTRYFDAALLKRGETPRLSIIFPRHAQNFRLVLRDLVIRRM